MTTVSLSRRASRELQSRHQHLFHIQAGTYGAEGFFLDKRTEKGSIKPPTVSILQLGTTSDYLGGVIRVSVQSRPLEGH